MRMFVQRAPSVAGVPSMTAPIMANAYLPRGRKRRSSFVTGDKFRERFGVHNLCVQYQKPSPKLYTEPWEAPDAIAHDRQWHTCGLAQAGTSPQRAISRSLAPLNGRRHRTLNWGYRGVTYMAAWKLFRNADDASDRQHSAGHGAYRRGLAC